VIARADATFAHNKLSHHPRGQTAVGYVEIDDEPAWSVARLNDEIAAILESAADRFPTYVVGEVSDATAKGYGTFFTLRDVEATYVNCWRNYTPRSGHNTRSSTTSAPQSTSTASRHPTTNSSSGTNSTRIRELSSCSMRVDKVEARASFTISTACRSLQLSSSRTNKEELFSRVDDRFVSRLRSTRPDGQIPQRATIRHSECSNEVRALRTASSPTTCSIRSLMPPLAMPALLSGCFAAQPARLTAKITRRSLMTSS